MEEIKEHMELQDKNWIYNILVTELRAMSLHQIPFHGDIQFQML